MTQRPDEKKAPPQPTETRQKTNENDAPQQSAANADETRYFYEFTKAEFVISHIRIEHDASGRGRILFERRGDTEPITEPFQLSEAALQRIKALWTALNFLDSTTDYQSTKPVASLGTTRLRMTRGTRERTAEFTYSQDRDAYALANEYRRAADQVIFVFEIEVARESQPLVAPKLLSSLESVIARNGLSDPQQLLPLLRELSTDERLPLIARNQAGRLLKKLEK
ncbi:MAG TPA: hypothetical protein VGV59_15235 [Pyrinomonadaceae bacterium]|nr:hypothetical protein [Pyrinomonadaceae bacterium]